MLIERRRRIPVEIAVAAAIVVCFAWWADGAEPADIDSLLGRPGDALPHFERAWRLGLDLGNRRAAALVACNLAGCLASLGDPESGIAWAERGLGIAEADGLLPAEEQVHAVRVRSSSSETRSCRECGERRSRVARLENMKPAGAVRPGRLFVGRRGRP